MPDSYAPSALFLSAFLAATLLPFSSEAALIAALGTGMDKMTALIAASFGNLLAITLNYLLGLWLNTATHSRLERSRSGRKALKWGEKHGYWALLLSWLPIIGDPITLVAGIFRLKFMMFILIAGTLRILRYLVIAWYF